MIQETAEYTKADREKYDLFALIANSDTRENDDDLLLVLQSPNGHEIASRLLDAGYLSRYELGNGSNYVTTLKAQSVVEEYKSNRDKLTKQLMNLNIKATGTTLTPAIESDIRQKMEALESFLHPEDKVHVEVGLESRHHQHGEIFRAEVRITPDGYFAESTGENLYEAIDLLVPKIKQQVTKKKDKWVSLRRRFGKFKNKLFSREGE